MRKFNRKNKIKYPEKTYMNLSAKAQHKDLSSKQILLCALALLLVIVALKYLVYNPLAEVRYLEIEAEDLQEYVDTLSAELEQYDDVRQTYRQYATGWMSTSELTQADRMEIVQLIEDEIMSRAKIHNISITENAASINLSGIDLAGASDIVQILMQKDFVASVNVYTANSRESTKDAMISMVIRLQEIGESSDESDPTDTDSDTGDDSNGDKEGQEDSDHSYEDGDEQ